MYFYDDDNKEPEDPMLSDEQDGEKDDDEQEDDGLENEEPEDLEGNDEGQGDDQQDKKDRDKNKEKSKDKEDGDSSDSPEEAGKEKQGQDGKTGEQGKDLDPDTVHNDMQNASDNLDAQKANGQGQGSQGGQSRQGSSANANANASGTTGTGGGTPSGGAPAGGTPPPSTPPPGGAELGANAANAGANAAATGATGAAEGAAASGSAAAAGGGAAAGSTAAAGASATAASGAAASGTAAAAGGGAAAALAPVIAVIAIVILILIIVVGVVFFLIAMPGQVIEKFKQLGMDFLDKFQALVKGSENVIHTEDLASVANYLERMGYDLKGEGFISAPKNVGDANGGTDVENAVYDDVQDVWRDESGQVVDLNSDPIMTYIVSDNLCFLIKNFNQNLEEATGGHGSEAMGWIGGIIAAIGVVVAIVFSPIAAIVAVVAVIAGSALAFATASNPNWGTGLISIWHEGDAVGIRGKAYDAKEKGYIELDPATKKLKIKRGWTNNAYTFDVDGWSGRYGMPLEFLLSVHIATQMPDLAIEMSTTFDTDVEVLLRSIEGGSIVAGVKKQNAAAGSTNDNDYITYKQLEEIGKEHNGFFDDLWNGLNGLISWLGFWKEEDHTALTLDDQACYILFSYGMPHSKECTCCEHIPGHLSTLAEGDEGCSGGEIMPEDTSIDDVDIDDIDLSDHAVCDKCRDRVTKVAAALKVVNDKNWESYTPYISKVTNHWFRDVYFVINENESGDHAADERAGINAVQVDDLYFYETGERWTVYETYESSDTIPEGFEVGDYKLYEYDPTKSGDGWENGYKLFTGSAEEVEERKQKITNGDTSVSRLVKKPVSEHLTNFSAYDTSAGSESIPWTQMAVSGDSKGELQEDLIYEKEYYDADNPNNNQDMLIYYKETRPGDVKQVEDGIRAETNPKIKNMFVNNSYYKYDGSIERAEKIMEDRKKYSEDDYANFNTENDPRLNDEETKKLISKVNISKDSLGAFSMLENTHTLDADYIYRDFKELIVELDYFDKEELSDKIQDVMQWLIPDAGSGGWPLRKYEKGETFYGTLINSKADIKLMEDAAIEDAEEGMEELEEEVEAPETPTTSPKPSNVAGSINTFVDLAYEIHGEMEGNNWDYCVLTSGQEGGQHMASACGNHSSCGRQHCDTYNSSHTCGLNTSIQDAISGHHNTCCATYVSWVLEEIGYGFQSHGAKETYDKVKELGFTPITDYNSLEPGDLLFNKSGYEGTDVNNIGHVQILGNNGEWLNAGSVGAINDPPKVWTPNFIIGMRPTLNGAKKQFEGYEPDQDVVAPVTGKIIEHGTVERENIETGEKEEVEFIKIQAIDHCVYDTDGSPTEQGKGYKAAVDTSINNEEYGEGGRYKEYDPEVQNDLEGYDYFYEEYKGVMDSFVIYIEGFDLTLYDADGAIALSNSADADTTKVSRYEPNTVYNMNNNDEEAYSLWKEDAKAYAKPYVVINGEEYIKEGTIIGKTCEDPEVSESAPTPATTEGEEATTEKNKGNGNYIRVILRDLQDSIVEDVENYIKIDDGEYVSTAQPYQAQEGELELLAALICHEGGAPYWMNCHSFDEKTAMAAAEAVGYVCINRALTNYGGHGTTITDQINAPGQYAGADTLASYPYCEKCLEAAEWCLKYDCMSITNPSGEPMTRDVQGQSGWDQCKGGQTCWWWIDTTGDGQRTEYDGSKWDTFFCHNGSEG